jgi:hypothetical protein
VALLFGQIHVKAAKHQQITINIKSFNELNNKLGQIDSEL